MTRSAARRGPRSGTSAGSPTGSRPPTLDQYGLLAAVSFEATRFTSRLDGHPLIVSVDLPTSLPPLGDEVAVAVYRITTEALTNVARHSNASSARGCHQG